MPGAIVRAGWPALPWGHHGVGPAPPSLEALRDRGVDMSKLELMMDSFLRLDSASPPMLMAGGSLRPMVWAAFASELMYYGEHLATCESRADHVAMHDGITLHDDAGSDASSTLRGWGDAIRTRFDADNLRHSYVVSGNAGVVEHSV